MIYKKQPKGKKNSTKAQKLEIAPDIEPSQFTKSINDKE